MSDLLDTPRPALRARVGSSMFMGATGAALTLIDPAKLHPATRTSLYIGTGSVTAALGWFASQQATVPVPSKGHRAAVALGLGAVSVAGTKFGFVIDAKIHQALVHRGVTNPRRVMAIGAGLITTVMVLLDPPRPESEATVSPERDPAVEPTLADDMR